MIIGKLARARKTRNGFSLIEVLLVLAIIGIISGIAIPAYLGQRRRAQVIGDASANAKVLAMQLETYKADNGNYGPGGTWTSTSVSPPAGYASVPFVAKGNSKMNFVLAVGATGLTYTISAQETATSTLYLRINQTGEEEFRLQ